MTDWIDIGNCRIACGDCLEILPELKAGSVDAVVTDPPYGLSFMGKAWDYDVPQVDVWRECLRVLKPGGHLLSFFGTRTYHRGVVQIEDAGFEIRDCIMWLYGSGFPKSLDVSKAIDKAAGVEREVVGVKRASIQSPSALNEGRGAFGSYPEETKQVHITAPATEAARQWDGWGTALKPACEPIVVARKPLEGTVAENVLRHGVGGINVDGCRIEGRKRVPSSLSNAGHLGWRTGGDLTRKAQQNGRWPANVIHDGSVEVVGLMPEVNGPWGKDSNGKAKGQGSMFGVGGVNTQNECRGKETGSAARFFYCAKASKADRDEGCEGLEIKPAGALKSGDGGWRDEVARGRQPRHDKQLTAHNHHPTVKPTDLMRYLCRLVTPPGGVVLDPFMGSGSTGKGASIEGFRFIGIERDGEYVEIARRRLENEWRNRQGRLFD